MKFRTRLLAGVFMLSIHSSFIYAQEPKTDIIRGVVQVIAYENLYGNEPKMLGRGSASVIDETGLLLTNNHVVDDGFGGTLDGFVVCLSKDFKKRPECHYTASLIERDVSKDIALLRIDETDIFEKSVDFSQFEVLSLDFSYDPEPQDSVVAVGYPWIGADTITQTVGVVAGNQEYNSVNYIKTDALIAGGNSGGPLMKDEKVIGVNTFGIGVSEGGLGYALLIADAEQFIEKNKDTVMDSGFDTEKFHTYLRTIEEVSESGTVDDELFDIQLPAGYRVVEYIPGKKLASRQMLQDDTNIQYFSFTRHTTPVLESEKDFSHYLQTQGLYYPGYQKVKKSMLGGYEAREFFDKTDPSEGLARGRKQYVIQLNEREIVMIDIEVPTYNESLFSEAKNHLESFLKTVMFKQDVSFKNDRQLILHEPSIVFKLSKERSVPVGREASSLGDMRYSLGLVQMYLGNMRETMTIKVYPQTRDLGKGLSIEELMRTQTEFMNTSEKQLLTVQGYEGYSVCTDNDSVVTNKQGNALNASSCQVYLVIDEDPLLPYIIEIDITAVVQNFPRMKQVLAAYLENGVVLPMRENSSEKASVQDLFVHQKSRYRDLQTQSPQFIKMINTLLERGILPERQEFRGDVPMTRGMVVERRSRFMFDVDIASAKAACGDDTSYTCIFGQVVVPTSTGMQPLSDILEKTTIDLDAYAAVDAFHLFEQVIELALAGIELPYNEFTVSIFSNPEMLQHLYPQQKQQLEDRRYDVYGKRKVGIDEVVEYGEYIPSKLFRRHKELGLLSDPYFSPDIISFTDDIATQRRSQQAMREAVRTMCTDGASFDCFYRYAAQEHQYEIITWGRLVSYLAGSMDAARFDETLLEKKDESGW